jgi:cytoskeleton protein RodZ
VTLLQRIRTPFTEPATENAQWSPAGSPIVGDLLRQRREELGLDIEPVSEVLRIKPVYLLALEEGRSDALPGVTYAIGFVRAYADYLGFDGEEVLARFKSESAGFAARTDLSFPMPLAERSLPGGAMLLVALILAICGYGTWYYLSTGERTRPERVAEVPAQMLPAKPAPAPTTASAAETPAAPAPNTAAAGASAASAAPAGPNPPAPAQQANAGITAQPLAPPMSSAQEASAPAAAPPTDAAASGASTSDGAAAAAAAEPQRILIHASANCWIQIRNAAHKNVFSRTLRAGETYEVPQETGLTMRTGNAGVLTITVDGKKVPSIGGVGTLRHDVMLDPAALIAGTAIHR